MPRGVYVRPPKQSEPAPAEQAPATLEVALPGGKKSTYREGAGKLTIPDSNSADALFGAPAQPPVQEPVIEQPAPVAEEPVQEPVVEEPKQETPAPVAQEPEEIDLEEFFKKNNLDPAKVRIKTKVDGVETVVPYTDVKKNYQLEKHLTKRGQQLGEERRKLEALMESMARTSTPQPVVNESTDPAIRALQAKIQQFEAVMPALEPVIYQNARQQLANELKEIGHNDFMDYIPEIDARAALAPDQKTWEFYQTFDGAKQLFFQIKAEKLAKNQTVPAQPKPIVTPVPQATKPPIVRIDGGGQASAPLNDDYYAKEAELLNEWKKNPKNRQALHRLMAHKGILTMK